MPAGKEIHKSLAKKRDGRTNGGSQMLYQNPHFVCVCADCSWPKKSGSVERVCAIWHEQRLFVVSVPVLIHCLGPCWGIWRLFSASFDDLYLSPACLHGATIQKCICYKIVWYVPFRDKIACMICTSIMNWWRWYLLPSAMAKEHGLN